LLWKWNEGDEAALNELLPLVYEELRPLAQSYLRRQLAQHSLQPKRTRPKSKPSCADAAMRSSIWWSWSIIEMALLAMK
jgi:hypothetical protein